LGLLLTADIFEFSWRYQLPALVLAPIAGALGVTALRTGARRLLPAELDDVDRSAIAAFSAQNPDAQVGPVAVVIAAYQEAATIGSVLDELPDESCGLPVHALVVVDGATDATTEVATARGALVCNVAVNRGQGAALRLGYHLARTCGARFIVTTDADGQYDISELPRLLEPLVRDEADFVTGSRWLGRQETTDRVRRAGSWFFARLATILTRTHITDTSFGFRAMKAEVTTTVTLRQPQYQSSELLVGTLAAGFRVLECPMTIRTRTAGQSKKGNNLAYGIGFARALIGTWLRTRFRRRHSGSVQAERAPT
jgi:glycosyltransferase involved in cell wall biosynthesis